MSGTLRGHRGPESSLGPTGWPLTILHSDVTGPRLTMFESWISSKLRNNWDPCDVSSASPCPPPPGQRDRATELADRRADEPGAPALGRGHVVHAHRGRAHHGPAGG